MTRYVTRREQAELYAAIAIGLVFAAVVGVAHMFGAHHWCDHPPRHHTHTSPRRNP